MMQIEQTEIDAGALPLAEFKEHMRLGTGFADDGAQDTLLEAILRAAIAAVEGRTGKVLLERTVTWSLTAWRDGASQAVPVAPVDAILEFKTIDRDTTETVVDTDAFVLQKDTHRPHLTAVTGSLPTIPFGGRAEVTFDAGFGPVWSDIPNDLAQAVFLLAAHFHEHRSATAPKESSMPFSVQSLLERWRTVRILGGGAA